MVPLVSRLTECSLLLISHILLSPIDAISSDGSSSGNNNNGGNNSSQSANKPTLSDTAAHYPAVNRMAFWSVNLMFAKRAQVRGGQEKKKKKKSAIMKRAARRHLMRFLDCV